MGSYTSLAVSARGCKIIEIIQISCEGKWYPASTWIAHIHIHPLTISCTIVLMTTIKAVLNSYIVCWMDIFSV